MTRTLNALGLVVLIGAPALIHIALFHSQSRALPLGLLLLQLFGAWLVLKGRFSGRSKWLLAMALAGLAGLFAWAFGTQAAVVSAGLTHAMIYVALLSLFGSTLMRGREPLVAGIMRRIRGPLPPELSRYGRQVTILWCGYFIAQLLGSLTLILVAPLSVWSFFINVLNVPLTLGLFAAEFVYHTLRFRHLPRSRIADLVKALAAWRLASPGKTPAG